MQQQKEDDHQPTTESSTTTETSTTPFRTPNFTQYRKYLYQQIDTLRSKSTPLNHKVESLTKHRDNIQSQLNRFNSHKPEETTPHKNDSNESSTNKSATAHKKPEPTKANVSGRDRRLMGFALSHLRQSATELNQKSDAQRRKEEMEKKIDQREHDKRLKDLTDNLDKAQKEFDDLLSQKTEFDTKLTRCEKVLDLYWDQEKAARQYNALDKAASEELLKEKTELAQTKIAEFEKAISSLLEEFGTNKSEIEQQQQSETNIRGSENSSSHSHSHNSHRDNRSSNRYSGRKRHRDNNHSSDEEDNHSRRTVQRIK
jgi:DNA repair exonuclease SbcCD ATPase subunit